MTFVSANVDVRESQWGQTPLMFAAAANRVAVIETLLAAGADPGITANVVDITARDEADSADRRERNRRVATLRERLMGIEKPAEEAPSGAEPEPTPARSAEARDAVAVEVDLQEEPEPLGYADLIGAHGGLTALLLAAREGHAGAVLALLGCVLGNVLSGCYFVAEAEGVSYLEALSSLTPSLAVQTIRLMFAPADLLFYGIAVYEGYQFSFKRPPEA